MVSLLVKMLNSTYFHQQQKHENVYQVKEFVLEKRITAHEVASILGTLSGSVHSILKDNLQMYQIATKSMLTTAHTVLK
jgi:hypothetical protein